MVTNQFERDLNDTSFLRRPGRVDMVVFQNTADAGDGNPGLQRCFRNYLHEGGMEKDLDLVGNGIKGTSVSINNAELQQLSNIGSATISSTQWGYVGDMDQNVKTTATVTFSAMTVNGNITITGTVDGVDVGDLKTDVDGFPDELKNLVTAEIQQLENIDSKTITNAQWGYVGNLDQELNQAATVIFATVDGVDVSAHTHGGAGQGGTVDHVNLANKGSNTHAQIDTHIGTTVGNPHSLSWDEVCQVGRTFYGANSDANSVRIGGPLHSLHFFTEYDYSPTISSSNTLTLRVSGGGDQIIFETNTGGCWQISDAGHLLPWGSNQFDLGSDTYEVADLWYCAVHDTTCADLSHYSYEELYGLFAQIKPMNDGGLHYNKHNKQVFPHIDFKTVPKEFAEPASKDMMKKNIWYKKRKKITLPETEFKKGETIAIDTGTHQYALATLVVKMGAKIKELEKQIESLKEN